MRKKRIPFGTPRTKLDVPERPGYVRRWVNDVGSRIHYAQEGGYKFVEDPTIVVGQELDGNEDLGGRVSKVVGTGENGPIRAYLMEIKQEWYEDDQEEKQNQIEAVEATIKRGEHQTSESRNMYIPSSGIRISRE